jgi:hypothetical protein
LIQVDRDEYFSLSRQFIIFACSITVSLFF